MVMCLNLNITKLASVSLKQDSSAKLYQATQCGTFKHVTVLYCKYFTISCKFYSVLLATISQNVLEISSNLMCTKFYRQTLLIKKYNYLQFIYVNILNCQYS